MNPLGAKHTGQYRAIEQTNPCIIEIGVDDTILDSSRKEKSAKILHYSIARAANDWRAADLEHTEMCKEPHQDADVCDEECLVLLSALKHYALSLHIVCATSSKACTLTRNIKHASFLIFLVVTSFRFLLLLCFRTISRRDILAAHVTT